QVETLASNHPNVTFLGSLPRTAIIEAMRRHRYLVFPSQCLEGFPLVYPEALACGLAVFAFHPSALADLAVRDGTGISVRWEEPWADVLVGDEPQETPSPAVCREVFEAQYSEMSFRERTAALIASLHTALRQDFERL